jgi:trafficking protein particle complex subunit 5
MKSDKELPGGGQGDLDSSLHSLGAPIGEKILELLFFREKGGVNGACSSSAKRETKIVQMLHFINKDVFKSLFGKQADGLEQSTEDDDEYRILDKSPITNRFANLGAKNAQGSGNSHSQNNCASFIAGMIEGMLCSSKMQCKVTAHLYGEDPTVQEAGEEGGAGGDGQTTIYVIKFTKEVTLRER